MILTDDECRNIYNAAMELPDRTAVSVTRYVEARILAKLREQEPHSWYSAREDEWMLESIRKAHELLNSYTFRNGKFDLPLYTHPSAERDKVVPRYCETCEQNVSEPCNSVDCSTPETYKWTYPAQPATPKGGA
jgi:hypothetical protein